LDARTRRHFHHLRFLPPPLQHTAASILRKNISHLCLLQVSNKGRIPRKMAKRNKKIFKKHVLEGKHPVRYRLFRWRPCSAMKTYPTPASLYTGRLPRHSAPAMALTDSPVSNALAPYYLWRYAVPYTWASTHLCKTAIQRSLACARLHCVPSATLTVPTLACPTCFAYGLQT